jgi:hypothetical protein
VAGSTETETFNAFQSEISFATSPLDVGPFTLSLGAGAATDRNFIDLPPAQFTTFNVDGTTIANVFTETGISAFFTFDNGIRAFGFDLAGFNNLSQSAVIINGQTYGFNQLFPRDGFFGVVSDTPFTTVELRTTGFRGTDGFGVDNVTFSATAAAVPEPATWAMMIGGFGIVGGAMRSARRRKPKVAVSYA